MVDNAKVSSFQEAVLSVIYVIYRQKPLRHSAIIFLSILNAKYPDQRIGRYFFKKYLGINIGKYSYGFIQLLNGDLHLLDSIGAFCSFASDLVISNGNHPIYRLTTHPSAFDVRYGFVTRNTPDFYHHPKNREIVIGNDVWIGQNVTVLSCVEIGDGAIVGAGSIVTKDVPPYAVVAGNPAKLIKYRFSEKAVELLLNSRWWNRSDEDIRELYKKLEYSEKYKFSEDHEKEITSCFSKAD